MDLLIVDDHLSVAETFARALAPEHRTVGMLIRAGDLATWFDAGGRCDCVIIDLVLPNEDAFEAITCIRGQHPTIGIIATSGFDRASSAQHALAAGADAYFSKGNSIASLRSAIDNLAADPGGPASPRGLRTTRRIQVLQGLASGCTTQQIARWLGISRDTVAEHIEELKRRCGAHTAAELVAAAVRLGLADVILEQLPPPPS